MSTLSLHRLPGIALDGRTLAWRIAPWLLPLSLYALWHLGAAQGWSSPQVLPPPSYVWDTLRDLAASGDLWLNLRASMMRVIIGFACGSPGPGRRHEPVAPAASLSAAQLQCPGADSGASLAALRAPAGGHRRAAEVHPDRQGRPGARHAEHAAGLPPDQSGPARSGAGLWLHPPPEGARSDPAPGHAHHLDLVMAAVIVVGTVGYAIDRLLDWSEARFIGRRGTSAVQGEEA